MNNSTKAAPMAKDETMLLVQLVAASNIILNKATNATNNRMKEQAWQNLTSEFNSSITSFPRTPPQLRLKWENLKKAARKRCASMRSSLKKTGGGKEYFPPDEVLDKVSTLLGSTCEGFSVEFGGDATMLAEIEKNVEMEPLVEGVSFASVIDGGDGVSSERVDQEEVLQNIQILETPPRVQNSFFSRASGSRSIAKRKQKMEEDKSRARINRENALAEYLIAKKKKIDLENEEKEIMLSKLKVELENAKLENLRLKSKITSISID